MLITRRLEFKDGSIELFGQRVNISSPDWLALYTLSINEDTILTKRLYHASKQSILDSSQNIEQYARSNDKQPREALADFVSLFGWGVARFEGFDREGVDGVITLRNTPIGKRIRNSVTSQCDHIARGILAGLCSILYEQDVDIMESECIGMGVEACRFQVNNSEKLEATNAKLYSKQV